MADHTEPEIGLNVEIKARVTEHEPVRRRLLAMGASLQGELKQTDIYFHAARGRLKLRTEGARAELIRYARPDQSGAKVSEYALAAVSDPTALAGVLESSLGVVARVNKAREVWRYANARIHLDEVEGLGLFVEFEVEATAAADLDQCHETARRLIAALALEPSSLVEGSYCDLQIRRRATCD